MIKYFTDLFISSGNVDLKVLNCVKRWLLDDQRDALNRGFRRDDVKMAVFAMHPDKAPRMDGLNPYFYQKY